MFSNVLTNLYNSFFGEPEPNTETTAPTAKPKPKKPTFRMRAQNYKGLTPDLFKDPITYEVMNNPIIVNDHQVHTFDKESLDKCLALRPGIDPLTNAEIILQEPNKERRQQMEAFFTCVEKIERLKNDIKKWPDLKVARVLNGQEITPEQRIQRINELTREKRKAREQAKIELIAQLQIFIKLVETAVEAEDKNEADKKKEIAQITNDARESLVLLRCEEDIDRLKKDIKKWTDLKVELVLNEEEITPEQRIQRINEMTEEKRKAIEQAKLELIVQLQIFIKLVETALEAKDKNESDKKNEIAQITNDARKSLVLLRSEFGMTHPHLFEDAEDNQSRINPLLITQPGNAPPRRRNDQFPRGILRVGITNDFLNAHRNPTGNSEININDIVNNLVNTSTGRSPADIAADIANEYMPSNFGFRRNNF